ncbi:MAG TPA: L,D-transpeptidase family protein, partial [Methylocella sp.]|nr:L,D-transpeptidase family protein [Methylocella sp.]
AAVAPVTLRLKRAADDGLDVKGFPQAVSPETQAFLPETDEEIARADLALSDAVVAYGRQASGSRVEPKMISRLIGVEPEVADPAVILALVASAGEDAGEALRRFNPPQKAYEALREKLLQLRRGRRLAGSGAAIPAGPLLRPGMRDKRVPLVRARLGLDRGAAEDLVYDTTIAAAVEDFQKANGLPASGHLTAGTLAALSGGHSSLEAEILANMERWRWMPRDMGETHIEVNIPDYEAVVIEKGAVIERNRVVVGKEQTPTPVFSETMKFLIVNPSWNVPQSIIRKEMLPRLASDPGYFQRMGYEVLSRGGHLVVRQPPGEKNALGRIKFVFPNDYSVYMHDTPLRRLFASAKRAFSHGCVRVDDPFRFAETVLGQGWSEERVKKLIGGRERYVYLPKPLPVYLEYFTAFVDEAGALQLRADVYGYSRRVKAALGLQG